MTQYAYDTLNRLTGLTDYWNNTFSFGYDALGRKTSQSSPNGISTSFTYDNLSRLLQVLHQNGSKLVESAAYTYDSAGNRLSRTETTPAGGSKTNQAVSNYSYDAIYQLTQTVLNGTTSETYSYDAVGNRLSSLGVSPYTYNSSNELTSKPAVTFNYDNNGNTTSKIDSTGSTSYTWDFENRLTSVTLPGSGGTFSFKYDPFGRRIYKSSSGGTTIYAYGGDNIVEQLNSSGTATARYTQGLGIDEPLEVYEGGKSYYYHADGLGSVVALTKSTGTAANTYFGYNTFGGMPSASETVANPFRFTGRDYDPETGLYYYRARYYDSLFGRFLSEDPVGFRGGIDFYAYALNDPADFNDPTGQDYHVTVEGSTIVVSASVTIYGPNATSLLAETWQRDVNRYWNAGHYRYGNCDVRFKVGFHADPGHNWRFTASPKSDNQVYVVQQRGDERYLDTTWSSYGRWLSGLVDQDVAHAMGHFFLLRDDYSLLFGTKKGHEGHMMSNDIIRDVAQHEVEDIVAGQACACKK